MHARKTLPDSHGEYQVDGAAPGCSEFRPALPLAGNLRFTVRCAVSRKRIALQAGRWRGCLVQQRPVFDVGRRQSVAACSQLWAWGARSMSDSTSTASATRPSPPQVRELSPANNPLTAG